jgi:signal transduction histidine kinase
MTNEPASSDPRTPAESDRFLLLVIHDLRSPLRQAVLRAQLLERTTARTIGDDGAAHLLAILESNRLADRFLGRLAEYCYAGADPGASPLVSAGLALQNAVQMAGADPEVEVVVEAVPECLVHSSVQRVFFELIDNAHKFRRGPVSVRIVSSCSDSECIFEVRDNGIGFESEFAETVWEPLQRLHGIGVYPGFGLGLAISRRIVSGLKGRTWTKSVLGEGSSFFFSIPTV